MSEQIKKKIGYKDMLYQKEYLKILLASLINRFGDAVDAIASTWIVYELTQSAAWSAIVYTVNKVPTILITPLAGAWVEGRNKKRIMIVTDLIRALCVAIIATGFLFGFLQAWMILIINFIISTAEAFRGPASTALTPKILKEEYYDYGMSLSSALSSAVEMVGMAVAAGIIALVGTAGAIYVDMTTFLLSAAIICFVNTKEEKLQKKKWDSKEYFNTLKSGFSYAFTNKVLLFYICLMAVLNAVLVPFNSLQAPLSNEILNGGAEVLSILAVALTFSMMLGSIVYPIVKSKMSSRFIVGFAGISIGLYYIALVVSKPLYIYKPVMYVIVILTSIICGFAAALLTSLISIEFIRATEEEYLARVAAVLTAVGQVANPVVSFILSLVAIYFSTAGIFMITGILQIFIILLLLGNKALNKEKATV